MKKGCFADGLAFPNWPGNPLMADPALDLDLALVTVAPPSGPGGKDLSIHDLLELVEKGVKEIRSQDRLRIVLKAGDIELAETNNRTAIVLGLQNSPAGFDHTVIHTLFDAGVRVFGLWYQDKNALGGGFACPLEPLSDEGKSVITRLAF
jgi:microsomal dipeptidase-like Zn-dependent dipeptidase